MSSYCPAFTHEARFPDGTPRRYHPPHGSRVASVVLADEDDGTTGVYQRDGETGFLIPCRTVTPGAEHYARTIAAWIAGAPAVEDLRSVRA